MDNSRSNLVFLAVGIAIGTALGYVAASDKREEWLKEAGNLVGKIKRAVHKEKNNIPDNETE